MQDLEYAQRVRDLFHFVVTNASLLRSYEEDVYRILSGLDRAITRIRNANQPSAVAEFDELRQTQQELEAYVSSALQLWLKIQDQVPQTKLADVMSPPVQAHQVSLSEEQQKEQLVTSPEKLAEPYRVFYSYADEDKELQQRLERHLLSLRKEGIISDWQRQQVSPGKETKQEVYKKLNEADIILILISADFFASSSYNEMQRAIERHVAKEAVVIPVLLRSVYIDPYKLLAQLKAYPSNGAPVTSWENPDEAFTDVARGIREAIDTLKSHRDGTSSNPPTTMRPTQSPELGGEKRLHNPLQNPVEGEHNTRFITSQFPQPPSPQVSQARRCDVLLMTAKLEETQVILAAAQQATGLSPKREFSKTGAYFDLHVIGGARTFLAQSEMGAGEPGGATLTIQEAIQFLSPSAVILVGVAFGMKPKKERLGEQLMGDILISRQLLNYELLRVGTDREGHWDIRARGSRPLASARLLAIVRNSVADWAGPKVHFGLMLSGEKLADNVNFREQLRQLEPEAIGGEMEGAGLYAAAERNHVDWIVIKAISDWADGKKKYKKSQRQQIAEENAIRLVMHVLLQGGLRNASLI